METNKICPNCRKPLPPDVPLGLCPECLIKSGFLTDTEAGVGGEAAGARFVPPPVEEIARLFPQLEILGLIGKGGMGAVYKARQPSLDRFVALKVLPPAVGSDPGFAERFNREARALARLNHPNIVAVHDFGKAGPLHYLVMEFVDGTNLREVEHAGRLSPEQALAIVPQICEALQFAHNEGIVHRDIKPENLLMDKKGRVKITDFGIAKIVGQSGGKAALTGAKDVVGTPHYMAPEQVEKPQTVDHRADIYSLGVVFYEMLTGELPLGKFQPPSAKVQIDVRLDEVVLHTLEKEPERRYQQVSQVKTAVETIASTAPPPHAEKSQAGAQTGPIPFPDPWRYLKNRFWPPWVGRRSGQRVINWPAVAMRGLRGLLFGLVFGLALGIGLSVNFGEKTGILAGIACFGVICVLLCFVMTIRLLRGFAMPFDLLPELDSSAKDAQEAFARQPEPQSAPARNWPWLFGTAALGVVVLVVFALSMTGGKPNVTITGIVTDAVTGKPIAHARVDDNRYGASPRKAPQQAWTDAKGHYELKTWYEEHNIAASAPGYETKMSTLLTKTFGSEREKWMDFKLQPAGTNTPATNGGSTMALNISSHNGQVVIETTNGRLSANNVQLQVNANGTTSVTGQKIEYEVPASTAVNEHVRQPPQTASEVSPAIPTFSATNPPVLAQSSFTSTDEAETIAKSFAVEPGGKLSVETDRGDIQVVTSDQNTVKVLVKREVTHAGENKTGQILKNHQVTLIQNGNEIQVRAKSTKTAQNLWSLLGQQPDLNVSLELTVPRRFNLNLSTSGGDVSVEGIQGKIEIGTSGGDLNLSKIQGPVQAHTSGGDILAADCAGKLQIRTSGGDVQINSFAGAMFWVETSGGDVSLDLAGQVQTNCLLRTSGGSVTARLPKTIAIYLDANTSGGEVSTEIPVRTEGKQSGSVLRGTINGGGPVLSLQTSGGDIQVLKR